MLILESELFCDGIKGISERLRLFGKAIALTGLGDYERGLVRVFFEFVADVADVDAQLLGRVVVSVSPD